MSFDGAVVVDDSLHPEEKGLEDSPVLSGNSLLLNEDVFTLNPKAEELNSRSNQEQSRGKQSSSPDIGVLRTTGSMRFLNGNSSLEDQLCAGCESATIVVYCQQCHVNYCKNCDSTAHSLKNKSNHTRFPPRTDRIGLKNCPLHPQKECEFYCNTCEVVICAVCKDFGEHNSLRHSIVSARIVADDARQKILNEVQVVQEILDQRSAVLTEQENTLKSLVEGSEASAAKKEISAAFTSFEEAVRERLNVLLLDIDDAVSWNVNGISHQQGLLQHVIETGSVIGNEWSELRELDNLESLHSAFRRYDDFFHNSRSVMRYGDPVERSEVAMDLPATVFDTIKTLGVMGGPMNVQFFVESNGECTVEWAPPIYMDSFAGLDEDKVLVAFDIKLLVHSQDMIEVDMGSRTVCADEDDYKKFSLLVSLRSYSGESIGFGVRAVYASGRKTAWVLSPSVVQLPMHFITQKCLMQPNEEPFSKSGVFYYLGTDAFREPYSNPHVKGAVTVTWSSKGSEDIQYFVSHFNPFTYSYTSIECNAWMDVDIGAGRELHPSGYSLRHDEQGPRGVLRNWVLQGRCNGSIEWEIISEHCNDTSLAATCGSEAYFPLSDVNALLDNKGYRYFRILQTGKNSSGKNRLSCSGFELYGILR